jgi:hypothetical protein
MHLMHYRLALLLLLTPPTPRDKLHEDQHKFTHAACLLRTCRQT